jgi:hypothetical protein
VKRVALIVIGVVIALAVLLWRLPASAALLAMPANASWQKYVSIHEINGTIWNGSARVTSAVSPATQRIDWRCEPSGVSEIACRLSGAATGSLNYRFFKGELYVASLDAQLPLRVTNAAANVESPSVSISLLKNTIVSNQFAGQINIVARDASFKSGNTSVELGEVFLDCAPANDKVSTACTLKNRASAAKLDGAFTLSPARLTGSIDLNAPGMGTHKVTF